MSKYIIKVIPAGHHPEAPAARTLEGEGATPLLALADAFDRAATEHIARATGRHARAAEDTSDTDGRDAGGFDVSGLRAAGAALTGE